MLSKVKVYPEIDFSFHIYMFNVYVNGVSHDNILYVHIPPLHCTFPL